MKGKIWRKILSVCLVLLMVAALVPTQLFSVSAASNIGYIYRWWDSASQKVKSETRYADATKLQDLSADLQDLNSGWYYSQNWIEFNKRVNIHGTVNIILCEEGGSYVKFKDGIHVSPGNTLNIYGQGNETQALEAFADTNDYAGIGGNGNEECGTINIYGGAVNAEADVDAAGIGGGFKGYGGHINIYGGKIDATGGSVNTNGGAGIGGGGQGWGGYIKIYGGDVTAHGGANAAGIGGGDEGTSGDVEIFGGTVNATGGSQYSDGGAGIGGGNEKGVNNIVIYGGNVTAQGGCDGAGIGGGDAGVDSDNEHGNITIAGGTVNATGGEYGAGIGSGQNGSGFKIKLNNANVTAKGGRYGAGVGGGDSGKDNTITISGGTVNATGGEDGAGIGGGDDGAGGVMNIASGDVTANGGTNGAGIGGGDNGAGGTVTVTGGKVTATGGDNGAGIGGGDSGEGGTININGGNVTATGNIYGAGIGGGEGGNGGNITINSGTVIANGGMYYKNEGFDTFRDGGAGIGGGHKGNGGTIKITGGEVTAKSGYKSAGIGGGNEGTSGDITITGGTVRAKTTGHLDAYQQISGGAAGIGDGMSSKGDPVRSITISGGDIVAQTSGEVLRDAHFGGAGIGAGYGGDGAEKMKITITGCEKLVANGGPLSAGIGGSNSKHVSEISISGDVNIIAAGGRSGAGIGGGERAKSGKITISGGTIEAKGGDGAAGIGSGSGCTEDKNAVDITINSGNIKAIGNREYKFSVNEYYLSGASIGAGGCILKEQGGDIKDASYFAGTINLNGGTITANRTIGATHEAALEDVTGTVNFNGAIVQIETSENDPSVRATNINLRDGEEYPQTVAYKNSDSDALTKVAKADRLATLQENAKKIVFVLPCVHSDMTFVDKGDDHIADCPHCSRHAEAPHRYIEPEWNWAEDYSSATATFTCEDCGHKMTINATSTSSVGDDGMLTYTVTVQLNTKSYTDIKQIYNDDLGARVVGYSISLDGDIGVNFYMELSDAVAQSSTAKMHFTIPKDGEPDTQEIKVSEARTVKSGDKTYHVFKCQVAAKEMTSDIKAQIIDGEKQGTVFTYSVKDYADYLLAHTDDSAEFAKAAPLVKALLNYGAYSQIHFDKNPGKLANDKLTEAEKALGTISIDIAEPVIGKLPEGTTFAGATLSLKSETTLSLYFKSNATPVFTCDGYDVETVPNGDYQVARIRGIKAAHIGDMFTLNVSGATVKYSPLNYCKKVLTDDATDSKLKNALKAFYLYYEAAYVYFYTIDLSTVTGNTVVKDGGIITGTLSGNHKISIADGATVMLRNADITSLPDSTDAKYSGITLLGDAMIILEGTNAVRSGYNQYPGIFVPEGKTLTIDGTGSLDASSNGCCGIGVMAGQPNANITINGGYITATGGLWSAGIGGGMAASCGNITINGGTVTAIGGEAGAGIGVGFWGSCGNITINGGTVTATGGSSAAGIGSGNTGECGNITINNTVTKVTATKGSGAPNSIGAGTNSTCGTVTIGDAEGAISESPYTYQPE